MERKSKVCSWFNIPLQVYFPDRSLNAKTEQADIPDKQRADKKLIYKVTYSAKPEHHASEKKKN